jgi:hypothetical protein
MNDIWITHDDQPSFQTAPSAYIDPAQQVSNA